MINNFFFTKSDFITEENLTLSIVDANLTKKLKYELNDNMEPDYNKPVKSLIDLIRNIEKYNDSLKTNYAKRVPYQLYFENSATPVYVAKVVFPFTKDEEDEYGNCPEGALVYVYAYGRNGYTNFVWGKDGTVDLPLEEIQTMVARAELIAEVVFGSFDPDDVDRKFFKGAQNSEMSTDALHRALDNIITDFNSNVASGRFKSAILGFNNQMIQIKNVTYNQRPSEFELYSKAAANYLNLIKSIVGTHDDPTMNNKYEIHKYYFFENQAEYDDYLAKTGEDMTASASEHHPRKNMSRENVFFKNDLDFLRKILSGFNGTIDVQNP